MSIKIGWQDLQRRIINGSDVQRVMLNWQQIRPDIPSVDYLYFTASQNSTVRLDWLWDWQPIFSFEISTDKTTWYSYTMGLSLPLLVGDKIYWRNTSNSTQSLDDLCRFVMTWSISAWWDVWTLLNANNTSAIPNNWLKNLFEGCSALVTPPIISAVSIWSEWCLGMFKWCTSLSSIPLLLATNIDRNAYEEMFYGCTSLTNIPWNNLLIHKGVHEAYISMFEWCTSLNTLPDLSGDPDADIDYAFQRMFYWCTSIKLSLTQWWEYQNPFIIDGYNLDGEWMIDMFTNTGWTFTGTPNEGVVYYTSNAVI